MIGRLWHGWTAKVNAGAYQDLLTKEVLPGIGRVEGFRGGYLMKRDVPEGVEFVTLTLFDSMDAVRAFAGPDHTKAVVPPEARRLLARFDERSEHFEIVSAPR